MPRSFSSCEKDKEQRQEVKRVLYSVDVDVWSYKFESEGQIQGLRTTGRASERERERDVFQESERRLPNALRDLLLIKARRSPAISLHLPSQLLLTSFLTVLPNPRECRFEKQIKYSV